MATNHVFRMLINLTFEFGLQWRDNSEEPVYRDQKKASDRNHNRQFWEKVDKFHGLFPSSHELSNFQDSDPEMISTIFTIMMVKGMNWSDTAMLKTM